MDKPKLYIPRNIYNKVMFWVDKCHLEIGGMGTVSYDAEKNYFWIRDVFLLEQEVSAATTDLNEVALGKLEHELIKNKVPGDLNFWWHSHVNMAVFWSGQDTETIKQLGEQGYCVATVFNKKREMRSAVCAKTTSSFGGSYVQFIDEILTEIVDPRPSDRMIEEWTKQYDERVKVKEWKSKSQREFEYPAAVKDESKSGVKVPTYSSRSWCLPFNYQVYQKLEEWRRTNAEADLTVAEKEWIIMAAATNYGLGYFNYLTTFFTKAEWDQLDKIAQEFLDKVPDFSWKAD